MVAEYSRERDWSDLPSCILSLILMRLSGRDRASFHCVCRHWQLVPFPTWLVPSWTPSPSMIRIPLLMFPGEFGFNFYHPVYNSTYSMNIPEIARATIQFSKNGWLLMRQGERVMFFFNPLTKERVNLPSLPDFCFFNEIAFSSSPTSRDCVVYGTHRSLPKLTNFGFIRHGEDTWSKYSVDNGKTLFLPTSCSPIFHKGVFYSLGIDGKLGEFDPNKDEEHCWTVHKSHVPYKSFRSQYLIECNGDLVSIYEADNGEWVKVYKLDLSNKAWKEISSLGNQMVFLSHKSAFAVSMQVPGMQNKIYFPRFYNNDGIFYSLGTGKFHTFWTKFSENDRGNIHGNKIWPWIEPSFEEHDNESLQWYSP